MPQYDPSVEGPRGRDIEWENAVPLGMQRNGSIGDLQEAQRLKQEILDKAKQLKDQDLSRILSGAGIAGNLNNMKALHLVLRDLNREFSNMSGSSSSIDELVNAFNELPKSLQRSLPKVAKEIKAWRKDTSLEMSQAAREALVATTIIHNTVSSHAYSLNKPSFKENPLGWAKGTFMHPVQSRPELRQALGTFRIDQPHTWVNLVRSLPMGTPIAAAIAGSKIIGSLESGGLGLPGLGVTPFLGQGGYWDIRHLGQQTGEGFGAGMAARAQAGQIGRSLFNPGAPVSQRTALEIISAIRTLGIRGDLAMRFAQETVHIVGSVGLDWKTSLDLVNASVRIGKDSMSDLNAQFKELRTVSKDSGIGIQQLAANLKSMLDISNASYGGAKATQTAGFYSSFIGNFPDAAKAGYGPENLAQAGPTLVMLGALAKGESGVVPADWATRPDLITAGIGYVRQYTTNMSKSGIFKGDIRRTVATLAKGYANTLGTTNVSQIMGLIGSNPNQIYQKTSIQEATRKAEEQTKSYIKSHTGHKSWFERNFPLTTSIEEHLLGGIGGVHYTSQGPSRTQQREQYLRSLTSQLGALSNNPSVAGQLKYMRANINKLSNSDWNNLLNNTVNEGMTVNLTITGKELINALISQKPITKQVKKELTPFTTRISSGP